MKLKQTPEDFIVQERIDLERIASRTDGRAESFSYFRLDRRGVEQLRALDVVAKYFKVPVRAVQCSGMKDAAAVVQQVVSVCDVDGSALAPRIALDPQGRIRLSFLGRFHSRIKDSDHEGNSFTVVVRDLSVEEAAAAPSRAEKAGLHGCLNYFDDQRFGYAGNSDKIGLSMIKGGFGDAVREILLSLPLKAKEEQNVDLLGFHRYVQANWETIEKGDAGEAAAAAAQAAALAPGFLKNEAALLRHLSSHPHDVRGGLNCLPRRLRFLYMTAFQARVFNQMVAALREECLSAAILSLPLAGPDAAFPEHAQGIYNAILQSYGIGPADLELKHLPEFGLDSPPRKTVIVPGNLKVSHSFPDDLNPGRFAVKLSFDLARGEYATNVVKQLFAESFAA